MMIKDFKIRFFVALILSVPIIALSPMIQGWFNFTLAFTGDTAVLVSLSVLIFFYGGWPFFTGAKEEIGSKTPGMMTLIALAISIAFLYSLATVFGLEGDDFFWELATLIVVMLLGHYIEMKSVLGAQSALDALVKLMPDTAHKKDGDSIKDVSINELKKGDIVLIKVGEKIPADGTIVKGSTQVNESMVTGESVPVKKIEKDELIGGSINNSGTVEMEVGKTGEDAYLSQVISLVQEAQASKSNTQSLADKAAKYLTYIALFVGGATFITWMMITGDLAFSITRMATVMVIACPHALGLATPLVIARSTMLSAKNGLLIRNRTAFERARSIDVIVFDKTGTLTEGNFGVKGIHIHEQGYDTDDILTLAASIENYSEHPIGLSILTAAKDRGLSLHAIEDFETIKGKGVKATIKGEPYSIKSPKALKSEGKDVPTDDSETLSTQVYLLKGETLIGSIVLSDSIREGVEESIRALQEEDIRIVVLSGDNEKTVRNLADSLGLDNYYAEILPEEKQEIIKQLQKDASTVAMAGDGVNDAPALAQADIGIAIGSGTDVAANTADIILVRSRPSDVLHLVRFGKKTYKKMLQNLAWATGYNILAIPLAAGVLFSIGILISPAVGAVFMSLSTVIVAFNARLLKA